MTLPLNMDSGTLFGISWKVGHWRAAYNSVSVTAILSPIGIFIASHAMATMSQVQSNGTQSSGSLDLG
jgi:hypothetical protein